MKVSLLLISLFLLTLDAKAAPCCAGSTAVPALITGDESQNFGIGISSGTVIGDAPGAGLGIPVFRDDLSPREQRQMLTLSYARLIDQDRLQAGVSVPLQLNSLSQNGVSENTFALSDVTLTLGYEALPEWDFSLWKPRVFSFMQLTLPTGRSLYESRTTLSTDATGLDQTQVAIGAIAIKRWSIWDANALVKFGRVFGRSFEGGLSGTSILESTWATAGSVGVGFSFLERYRAGSSLAFDYQSPLSVQNSGIHSVGSQRLVWNAGLTLTYLHGSDNSFVLGYQDQTLFGPALNSSLSRTFSLAFNHRVER